MGVGGGPTVTLGEDSRLALVQMLRCPFEIGVVRVGVVPPELKKNFNESSQAKF